MTKWEDVLTLLKVADRARLYPQLKSLHDQALATLGAVDPNALAFDSQAVEPIEDDVEEENG